MLCLGSEQWNADMPAYVATADMLCPECASWNVVTAKMLSSEHAIRYVNMLC